MVAERLIHDEKNFLRGGISELRICRGGGELRDYSLKLTGDLARVVHEESAIGGILRMKCEAEQAQFPAGNKIRKGGHVQKWSGGASAVAFDDLNAAVLFHDEEAAGIVIRLFDIERCGETCCDG